MGDNRKPSNFKVADPIEEDLGPKMLALTSQQRRFVVAWIGSRGKSAAACARAAGYYDGHQSSCAVQGFHNIRHPKIIAAIKEEAERRFDVMAVRSILSMDELLDSRDAKMRLKVADSILDRTGYSRRTQQDIRVEHTDSRSTAELFNLLERMKPKALGSRPAPVVIDVEPELDLPEPPDAA